LNIRPATNSDSDEIKAVVFGVLKEYGLEPDPGNTDEDLDSIDSHYWKNGGYFGVVEDGNIIVATIGLYRVDQQTCELRKMYALPSQRGKGLGRKLMEFALRKAKEMGFKRIVLETAAPLKEAIGLYKRFGFQEFEPKQMASRCDQAMELDLSKI
jgi:putative acetyltransferase